MQYAHETYIVLALKFNNNALFTVMWLPTTSLHAVKTWSRKKELDPCVMRELAAMLKCDFLARAAALEDGRVQVGQRGQEASLGKEGRKEARKKGRKKEINCTPTLARLLSPRGCC